MRATYPVEIPLKVMIPMVHTDAGWRVDVDNLDNPLAAQTVIMATGLGGWTPMEYKVEKVWWFTPSTYGADFQDPQIQTYINAAVMEFLVEEVAAMEAAE